jgi:hypothetical protein
LFPSIQPEAPNERGFHRLRQEHIANVNCGEREPARSMKRAKEMVQAGATGTDWFDDPNAGGRMKPMRMSPAVYVDFFDPEGLMNFARNAAAVQPGALGGWVPAKTPGRGASARKSTTLFPRIRR